MAAEGGRIDFMFLGPPLPGRWIRYCILWPIDQTSKGNVAHAILKSKCAVLLLKSSLKPCQNVPIVMQWPSNTYKATLGRVLWWQNVTLLLWPIAALMSEAPWQRLTLTICLVHVHIYPIKIHVDVIDLKIKGKDSRQIHSEPSHNLHRWKGQAQNKV